MAKIKEYEIEVWEMVRRTRTYTVEARSKKEAEALALKGETIAEADHGVMSESIVNRELA